MTPDQRHRLEDMCMKYCYCFISHGPLHNRHNEKRVEAFKNNPNLKEYQFIRITADITYMFWNPIDKRHP